MNCKPGDLAIVVGTNPKYVGTFVEVLYAAPLCEFTLPDGYPHFPADPGEWVVHVLGAAPVRAPVSNQRRKSWRMARYGTALDRQLRPIRGDEAKKISVRELEIT